LNGRRIGFLYELVCSDSDGRRRTETTAKQNGANLVGMGAWLALLDGGVAASPMGH